MNIQQLKELVTKGQQIGKPVFLGADELSNLIERMEAAERERDELRKTLAATQDGAAEAITHSLQLQTDLKTSSTNAMAWMKRALLAEKEVERRDTTAGERDELRLEISRISGAQAADVLRHDAAGGIFAWHHGDITDAFSPGSFSAHKTGTHVLPLYTAAPPAVLPPSPYLCGEPEQHLSDYEQGEAQGRCDMWEQVRALGAQPQKVVELPALLTVGQVMHQSGYDRQYAEGWSSGQASTVNDFIQLLQEANVPYEVKK